MKRMERLSRATEVQVCSDSGFVPIPLSIMPYTDATMVLPPTEYKELRMREITNRTRFQMDLLSDSDEERPIAVEDALDTGELSTDTELAAGSSDVLYINEDHVAEAVRNSVSSPEADGVPVWNALVEEAVNVAIWNVTWWVAEQHHLQMQEELMGKEPTPMEAEPSVEP